jgi:hypothetical protein
MARIFPESVQAILRSAGWFEGRRVDPRTITESSATLFKAALDVLQEFGGLHFGTCEDGTDFLKGDVRIDPGCAVHVGDELRKYEDALKVRLFPLGWFYDGDGILVIDEEGTVYALTDELEPLASSFYDLVEMLLLGKYHTR